MAMSFWMIRQFDQLERMWDPKRWIVYEYLKTIVRRLTNFASAGACSSKFICTSMPNVISVLLLTAVLVLQCVIVRTSYADDHSQSSVVFFAKGRQSVQFEKKITRYLEQLWKPSEASLKNGFDIVVVYEFAQEESTGHISTYAFSRDYTETELFLNLMRPGCVQVSRYQKQTITKYKALFLLLGDLQFDRDVTDCIRDVAAFDAASAGQHN